MTHPEQIELPALISAELSDYRESLRQASARIGVKVLAADLGLAPESVHHQLGRWDRRKQPSAQHAYLALRRDLTHRMEVADLIGCILSPKPRMRPEDFVRAVQERASKGYVSAAEIAQLAAQTDLPGVGMPSDSGPHPSPFAAPVLVKP